MLCVIYKWGVTMKVENIKTIGNTEIVISTNDEANEAGRKVFSLKKTPNY